MADGIGVKPPQIHGIHETLAALRALDKNAARRVNAAINKAAGEVRDVAKGLVDPQGLSGWQRQLPGGTKGSRRAGYNPAEIAAGIKLKRKRPKKNGPVIQSAIVIANTSAAGAIWEVAGRKSDGKTPAGMAMVKAMRQRGGAASRTVWAAADQTDMGHVHDVIVEQVNIARKQVQSMIDKA